MDLATEASDYVDAFAQEFGALPDLDSPSDSEHATAALESTELRGVAWEQWAGAVRVEVARRRA